MTYLRTTESFFIATKGIPRQIRKGQLLKSDDPLIKGREHLFRADVEQATAAPGEKRTVTRKR